MKRQFLALSMAIMMFGLTACAGGGGESESANTDGTQPIESTPQEAQPGEVVLEVCTTGNPVVGDKGDGTYVYGGDPFVLVDGDTVYLYSGHDTAKNEAYLIPEYICYSSTDLVTWKDEGVVMKADKETITWSNTGKDAWAAQAVKHYDAAAGKDKYYLYFCTWDSTSSGKQSIGVAVSDSPTGPFEDIGQPLVKGTVTEPQTSDWNDIDPTIWIENDENGEEHRYLAWGNGIYYICELNEDMISVKDINGDGQITCGADGDIRPKSGLNSFTEAPWLYRRQDENGNYYGDYYLFYASGWREGMSYATTDDLMNSSWFYEDVISAPSVTSNTNHMAVFDFKGKTYFVYHNGALPGGSGFRRIPNIRELEFNSNGGIELLEETAAGISGKTSVITLSDGSKAAHANFRNSAADNDYPYTSVAVGLFDDAPELDSLWVIRPGKADKSNSAYVSIESENKPGLFITANADDTVTLAQEAKITEEIEAQQTFHTVSGLADAESGVSFESVSQPGKYLTMVDGVLSLSDGTDQENSTFYVNASE